LLQVPEVAQHAAGFGADRLLAGSGARRRARATFALSAGCEACDQRTLSGNYWPVRDPRRAHRNVRSRGIAAVASVKLNGSKGSIAPSSDRCVLCDMDGVERAALGAVNGLGPQFDQVSVIRLVWSCRDENGRLRPRQATDYTY
jgi:hypothetical protein